VQVAVGRTDALQTALAEQQQSLARSASAVAGLAAKVEAGASATDLAELRAATLTLDARVMSMTIDDDERFTALREAAAGGLHEDGVSVDASAVAALAAELAAVKATVGQAAAEAEENRSEAGAQWSQLAAVKAAVVKAVEQAEAAVKEAAAGSQGNGKENKVQSKLIKMAEAQKTSTDELKSQLAAVKQEIVKIDSLRDVLDTQRRSLAQQESTTELIHADLVKRVNTLEAGRVGLYEGSLSPTKLREALEAQQAATREMRGQLAAVKQEIVKLDSLRDVLDTQKSVLAAQQAAVVGVSHEQLHDAVAVVNERVAALEAAAAAAATTIQQQPSPVEVKAALTSGVLQSLVTLKASCVTLRARWVTPRARWVTLRARWVTLRASCVTLRARWVTLRARWATLRACWATLAAAGAKLSEQHNQLAKSHAETAARAAALTERVAALEAAGRVSATATANKAAAVPSLKEFKGVVGGVEVCRPRPARIVSTRDIFQSLHVANSVAADVAARLRRSRLHTHAPLRLHEVLRESFSAKDALNSAYLGGVVLRRAPHPHRTRGSTARR
jgi:hypothetical protein